MIERLIHSDQPCEGPEYRKRSEQIIQLKQELCRQLDQQGKQQLDQLTDLYLEQTASLTKRSFTEGFCTAVDLALDYFKHRSTDRSITNQQQPPES